MLFKRVAKKLRVLVRKFRYKNAQHIKVILNAFIIFPYFLLIWIFLSRTMEQKINRIQERKMGLGQNYVTLDKLLAKSKYFIIYKKHAGIVQQSL